MTADPWPEIEPVIADAIELPPDEREAFVSARIQDPIKRELALEYVKDHERNPGSTDFKARIRSVLAGYQDEPVAPGTLVGPYSVTERIGQGGMAWVYRGYDTRLHRPVALKVLLPSVELVDERAGVLREARAAAQINHTNVATIHDIIEDGNRAFIVMEFLDGDDLTTVLRGPRLPLERALSIGRQLASALAAAHARGVIHRDLKPGNIKVLRSGTVKVMDFGIAGLTGAYTTTPDSAPAPEEPTRPVGQPGTPGYMAPEQYGTPHFDERSDLFSLGVVLFEMVTGELAYPDRRRDALAAAVQQPIRRADSVDREVPGQVADVIARATSIEPSRRYGSAAAVESALAAAERAVIVATTTNTPVGQYVLAPPAPLTWRRALRVAAPWVLPAIAVVWALGALSTAVFNQAMGREHAFRTEVWFSSLDYGRKSLFVPVLFMCAGAALWWAGCFVVRVLRPVPGVGRAIGWSERIVDGSSRALNLDDPRSLGQAATAVAVAALAVTIWVFKDLMAACLTELSDARPEVIAQLATGHAGGPYRAALLAVLLLLGAALLRIVRLSAQDRSRNFLVAAPVVAAAVVALLLLQFPYRLLWNTKVPQVNYKGEACYLIGYDADRYQLFCPGRDRGRKSIVDRDDPDIKGPFEVKEMFDIWTPGPDGAPLKTG